MSVNRSKEVSDRDYTEGACWHGIKISKRDTVPCNLDARLYRIERKAEETGFGFVTTPGRGPSMETWLCDNHKTSMEKDGFVLTLIR